MTDFIQFGLPSALLEILKRMEIHSPTPIQKETIPVALRGKDVLASAQTGSGKTIAYLIPLILKLSVNSKHTALVLTPTRELATQVHQVLNKLLGDALSFKTALLIGGAPMFKQISSLKKKPQLIVGTPGRIMDHLTNKHLSLQNTNFLVVDEADRMLDMGFEIQLNKIAESLPLDRQTLMFSATLPPHIQKLTKKYLQNPERISIDISIAAPKIKQETIHTTVGEKFPELLKQLEKREDSIIVFVKTRHGAEKLSKQLKKHGHSASAIHGNLSQSRRDKVIYAFRNCSNRIMVATDIAARGLDIPHIMHVINYDLPQCPEDYVHRIGRTARAGAEGNAICFITPEDNHKWRLINKFMRGSSESDQKPSFSKTRFPRSKKRFFKKSHPSRFQKKMR